MKSPHETGAIRDLDKGGTDDRQNTKPETPQQYRVVCESFRAFNKNTLQGFATLAVEPPGISIRDCAVHSKSGKRWVNFPARQYADEDGVVGWQNLVTIDKGSAYWRFQEAACEAIDAFLDTAGTTLVPEPRQITKEGDANELPF